jgi:O-methyltransferase
MATQDAHGMARELSSISRRVIEDKLTYLSVEKLERIEWAMERTARVPGDVVEFGVALGGSAIILTCHGHPNRRFTGFDVFSMIPPPGSDKDDEKSKERYEVIRSGGSQGIGGNEYYGYKSDLLSEVKSTFDRYGFAVDGREIRLVAGLFEETWPLSDIESVSLAHIDCDWYDPVKFCLAAVAEKLGPDGIIIVDDYHDYGGCRAAVDEFLAHRTDFAFHGGANPFLTRKVR